MKSHTYSRFKEGMDKRYRESDSRENGISLLENCYIDKNNRIQKRPAAVHKGELMPLELTYHNRGLFTYEGKKWVITGDTVTTKLPDDVWQLQLSDSWRVGEFYSVHSFLGGLYIAARMGSQNTHWFVVPGRSTWEASTAYTVGERVLPTAAIMTNFNAINVQFYYEVTIAGTSAASEPTWPTTHDDTIVDGGVTWKTVYTRIDDENCPETPVVIVLNEKVYAIGSTDNQGIDEHDIVRFSATGKPRDWSSADDAGFLPTGVQSTGSETPTALGRYNDNLVVFMEDTIEIWAVDPDPSLNALLQVIGGVGTTKFKSLHPIGTDLLFLSPTGIRSIGQQAYTVNAQDNDVGTPVDEDVIPSLSKTVFEPVAKAFPDLGQYWCAIGKIIWVWTWSRNSEVRAWAKFVLPSHIRDLAYLNGIMYARVTNHALIAFDPKVFTDYDGPFTLKIEFSFQSNRAIGIVKQYTGIDLLMKGSADISMKYDPNNTGLKTTPITATGNTRPGMLIPVECMTTEIAPVIEYTGIDDFNLQSMTLYYEPLGNV